MSQQNDWQKFNTNLLRYSEPDLWLDLSLMDLPNDLIETKEKCINKSLDEIRKIEEGAKVNTDEDKDSGGRRVGHYWLRNPELAPDEIGISIQRKIAEVKAFSSGIHKGEILTLTALSGAGRTELAYSLFGFIPSKSGEIFVNNKKTIIDSTSKAIKNMFNLNDCK